MILSLKHAEAEALAVELAGATDDANLNAVKDKLERALGPRSAQQIPGQTTIDDHLGEAA